LPHVCGVATPHSGPLGLLAQSASVRQSPGEHTPCKQKYGADDEPNADAQSASSSGSTHGEHTLPLQTPVPPGSPHGAPSRVQSLIAPSPGLTGRSATSNVAASLAPASMPELSNPASSAVASLATVASLASTDGGPSASTAGETSPSRFGKELKL
jgi:hypothetical protein